MPTVNVVRGAVRKAYPWKLDEPELESHVLYLLVEKSWASYLTSLNLTVSSGKVESACHRRCGEGQWPGMWKCFPRKYLVYWTLMFVSSPFLVKSVPDKREITNKQTSCKLPKYPASFQVQLPLLKIYKNC